MTSLLFEHLPADPAPAPARPPRARAAWIPPRQAAESGEMFNRPNPWLLCARTHARAADKVLDGVAAIPAGHPCAHLLRHGLYDPAAARIWHAGQRAWLTREAFKEQVWSPEDCTWVQHCVPGNIEYMEAILARRAIHVLRHAVWGTRPALLWHARLQGHARLPVQAVEYLEVMRDRQLWAMQGETCRTFIRLHHSLIHIQTLPDLLDLIADITFHVRGRHVRLARDPVLRDLYVQALEIDAEACAGILRVLRGEHLPPTLLPAADAL